MRMWILLALLMFSVNTAAGEPWESQLKACNNLMDVTADTVLSTAMSMGQIPTAEEEAEMRESMSTACVCIYDKIELYAQRLDRSKVEADMTKMELWLLTITKRGENSSLTDFERQAVFVSMNYGEASARVRYNALMECL